VCAQLGAPIQESASRNSKRTIAELRDIADGRLAETAGIEAGAWYAWPSTHAGYELVAAGMLIMAAATTVNRWTMTSWSVGRASATSGG
jgi:hypothetical protein